MVFWSFWPPDARATARTMNWSVVVTGAAVGFSVVYYAVWGRRGFRGPLVEGGCLELGEEGVRG